MNIAKSNDENSQKGNPSPRCGDFQKMAEMMKTLCPAEGDPIDCCSVMMKMMGQCKGGEAKGTKETRKPPEGGEQG